MSEMTETETFERFSEGLKKAASRCRELGVVQKDRNWTKTAIQIEQFLAYGTQLYRASALSRREVLGLLDQRVDKKKAH